MGTGLNTYIMTNFLGGPKILPCRITINLFKSLTLFFCFFLMYYFNTYNLNFKKDRPLLTHHKKQWKTQEQFRDSSLLEDTSLRSAERMRTSLSELLLLVLLDRSGQSYAS